MGCGQMGRTKQGNQRRTWWDCVEEEFQLARVKYVRDGEAGRGALGVGIVVSVFGMNQN